MTLNCLAQRMIHTLGTSLIKKTTKIIKEFCFNIKKYCSLLLLLCNVLFVLSSWQDKQSQTMAFNKKELHCSESGTCKNIVQDALHF